MSDNPIQLLSGPAAGDAEHLAALHAALVERASAESSVDATYRVVDSPVGALLLAATETGVVRVAFDVADPPGRQPARPAGPRARRLLRRRAPRLRRAARPAPLPWLPALGAAAPDR